MTPKQRIDHLAEMYDAYGYGDGLDSDMDNYGYGGVMLGGAKKKSSSKKKYTGDNEWIKCVQKLGNRGLSRNEILNGYNELGCKLNAIEKVSGNKYPKLKYKKDKMSKSKTKRPLSDYQIFVGKQIKKLRKEYPNKENGDYMKMAAKLWNKKKGDLPKKKKSSKSSKEVSRSKLPKSKKRTQSAAEKKGRAKIAERARLINKIK